MFRSSSSSRVWKVACSSGRVHREVEDIDGDSDNVRTCMSFVTRLGIKEEKEVVDIIADDQPALTPALDFFTRGQGHHSMPCTKEGVPHARHK